MMNIIKGNNLWSYVNYNLTCYMFLFCYSQPVILLRSIKLVSGTTGIYSFKANWLLVNGLQPWNSWTYIDKWVAYFFYFSQLSMQKYWGVLDETFIHNGWLRTLKWIALLQVQLLFVLVNENIFNVEVEIDIQDDLNNKVEDKGM